MVMICHCRQINDESLQEAFVSAREAKGGDDLVLDDITPRFGEFACGGCSRIFARAVDQFNETGEINLFKRTKAAQKGLCATAASRDYAFAGVPNLRNPAIAGIER